MFVVVDAGADSGVILVPLTSLDLTVTVLVTEVCEELEENLVLSHLTALYLGVHGAVVYASEVGGSDLARTISVELEESLVNHSLSLIVEGSLKVDNIRKVRVEQPCRSKKTVCVFTYADTNEELIEVDGTITIGVEEAHEGAGFVTGDADLDFTETRVELLSINLVVAVERVEVSESSSETSDGLGTASFDLCFNSLEN